MKADPGAASQVIYSPVGDKILSGGGKPVQTQPHSITLRQHLMSVYWAFYRCENYKNRSVDWDGGQARGMEYHDSINTGTYIPPGFVDVNSKTQPVKNRKPAAPAHLAKTVVDRYTGLLFGETRVPRVVIAGDPDTERYMNAIATHAGLWPLMQYARTLGGGMGAVAVGFQLVNGEPVFEVHDGRWTMPVFTDGTMRTLSALDKRYTYPVESVDRAGKPETLYFWYRRVITATHDVVWEGVPSDGKEPEWSSIEPKSAVEHGLGVVPAVWIKNTRVDDAIDGDPDCYGAFEAIQSHDVLRSVAMRSVIANCDPTKVIASDEDFSDIPGNSSSGAALQVEKGGSLNLLEMSGTGAVAARELAKEFKESVYEQTAYVPDVIDVGPQQTAFEVATRMSRMSERCDAFRMQYGQALVTLLHIVDSTIRATNTYVKTTDDLEGEAQLTQRTVTMPPYWDEATSTWRKHALGPGGIIELKWPRYFKPTLQDAQAATTAAVAALGAGAIDTQAAAEFLSEYLGIADVHAMLDRMASARQVSDTAASNGLMDAVKGVR